MKTNTQAVRCGLRKAAGIRGDDTMNTLRQATRERLPLGVPVEGASNRSIPGAHAAKRAPPTRAIAHLP